MKKESFIDLEKVRLKILLEKLQSGLNEFDEEPKRQWTALRFERPLLNKLLELVELEMKTK